ncbi:MAG: D-alanyl-D-alanine carboxypeptidase [Holosporales bacterium]|nr:D-alanyl-D-alanine carboxypeptidase [Holosporales bacterium]
MSNFEEFLGAYEANRSVLDVREDSSIGATPKLPKERSFRNRPMLLLFLLFMYICGGVCEAKRVHAYIVVNVQNGEILSKKNADKSCPPASLTKKMTLYLLFEAISTGRITFNTSLPVSARAAQQIPTKLHLREGNRISVKTAVEALIVKSANDAAVVIAEGLCGSVEQFVKKMNAKAKALGMHRTHFCNPSGVPDPKQKTTARDMAILARALFLRFPRFSNLFKLRSFDYNGRTYFTHNYLLNKFQGTNGIKTGYVYTSGYSVSTSASRYDASGQEFHFLAVVIGKNSSVERDNEAIGLLEPLFLKKRAVFYDANAAVLPCKSGIPLLNSRAIKCNQKKPIFIRAAICTNSGINLLLKQYVVRKKSYALLPQ